VAEVREAIQDRLNVDSKSLDAWASWALQEADALDPILSGQVLKHLRRLSGLLPKNDHCSFEPDGPPAYSARDCGRLTTADSAERDRFSPISL
jgi:hypothetical protein